MIRLDVPRRAVLTGLGACAVSACSPNYARLPAADAIVVQKGARRLTLLQASKSLKAFPVQLGFQPNGHKTREGDGRTPEGLYWVDRKNPRSSFHLSLGLNYPNQADVARAAAMGVEPGGDIFIHGQPNGTYDRDDPDWTAGCIAVRNVHIEEIYARVPIGTPVRILA